ncbi:MFS transporter [Mycolicibacterium moriokaense]|nr:MFS transporter [Mycolicibacterium moriokaense]
MNETVVRSLSARRKAIILVSCCLSLLIVSMDATIVNVAIPSIRDEFHASSSQIQWVIDIYTLVLASLLLLSGAAGDRFGRRRTFQTGLTIFALASLMCSLAPNIQMLIGARFLQAIGGSMMNPSAMSIITQVFRGRVERARAIGVWGGVVGISMAAGPIVGGALIEYVDWRAVFWINLPICAIAILLTAIFVPESKSATMRDVDPIGQALGMAFLFGVVFVLIEGPGMGWTSARIITVAVLAAVAFIVFLRYEAVRHDPFIDLRFFRSIPFASATMIAVCAFASWGAFLFMMSLYLQGQRGFSAMHTGLIYLPVAVGALIFSPLSGRLVGRFGSRPSLLVAGTLITAATLLLTRLTGTTPVWQLLVIFAVFGIGFSTVNAPITTAAVSGMPTDRAGAASAVASTSRQVGVSLGVALCGSVAGTALATTGADFAIAARPLWFICAALGVTIFALGLFSTSARATQSAERLAPLIDQSQWEGVRVR